MFQSLDGGECIFDIIPPKAEFVCKPRRFKCKVPNWQPTASTFHGPNTTNPTCSNVAGDAVQRVVSNRSHADLGRAPGGYANAPKDYMKKFAKSCSVPCLSEVKKTNPAQLKPLHLKESRFQGGGGPPKAHEIPVMNLVSNKNFIVANAVETILAAPKKTTLPKAPLKGKAEFGKVPNYIHKIKKAIQDESDYIAHMHDQIAQDQANMVQPLDDDERFALLDGLKAKWESTNTLYQAMTHMSVMEGGQKKRKERYEAELSSLEKDIEKLGRHSVAVDISM